MMNTLDPELKEPTPAIETARPTSMMERFGLWVGSLVEELESADIEFDPMIDYPRDI
jgi:hypothetical protein